jgi:hypothetical protein
MSAARFKAGKLMGRLRELPEMARLSRESSDPAGT